MFLNLKRTTLNPSLWCPIRVTESYNFFQIHFILYIRFRALRYDVLILRWCVWFFSLCHMALFLVDKMFWSSTTMGVSCCKLDLVGAFRKSTLKILITFFLKLIGKYLWNIKWAFVEMLILLLWKYLFIILTFLTVN